MKFLEALTITLLRLIGIYLLVTGVPLALSAIGQIISIQASPNHAGITSGATVMLVGSALISVLSASALIAYAKGLSRMLIPGKVLEDQEHSLGLDSATRAGLGLIGAALVALKLPWLLARSLEMVMSQGDFGYVHVMPNALDELIGVALGLGLFFFAFRAKPFLRATKAQPESKEQS